MSWLPGSSSQPDDLRDLGRLARLLGYLPLALPHAAAVILDEAITCAEYSGWFADRAKGLPELFRDAHNNRERTVADNWSLAVGDADRLRPGGFSRPLLTLISSLDPDGIPEMVLTADAARKFVGTQMAERVTRQCAGEVVEVDGRASVDQQRSALRAAYRLSLITHNPADVARSVQMNRMAQRAILESASSKMQKRAYVAAADSLSEVWPDIERDMELSAVLRQNVTTLAGLADDMLWQSSVHPILIRAGWSMEGAGLADSALRYWIGLRSISEQRLGRKHPDTLTIRRELAYCLGQSGKPAVAVTELEGLLDDFLQVLGPRSRETLTLRRYLDWWRGETRDPFGAVAAYEKLRDDALHVLGSDDIETLTARYNLGRWRGQAGRPDQAIDDLEALLDDCRRVIGPDGLLTLDVRHDLAWWYGESGDSAAAVEAYEAILRDRYRILGPDHLHTLATRHDLAWWRWDAGDRDRANTEFDSGCADYERIVGPTHPHTLATYSDLEFLRSGGRHSDTHGRVRGNPGRVHGDLPGLDFVQPTGFISGPNGPLGGSQYTEAA